MGYSAKDIADVSFEKVAYPNIKRWNEDWTEELRLLEWNDLTKEEERRNLQLEWDKNGHAIDYSDKCTPGTLVLLNFS
jgi:hypothetical protein